MASTQWLIVALGDTRRHFATAAFNLNASGAHEPFIGEREESALKQPNPTTIARSSEFAKFIKGIRAEILKNPKES